MEKQIFSEYPTYDQKKWYCRRRYFLAWTATYLNQPSLRRNTTCGRDYGTGRVRWYLLCCFRWLYNCRSSCRVSYRTNKQQTNSRLVSKFTVSIIKVYSYRIAYRKMKEVVEYCIYIFILIFNIILFSSHRLFGGNEYHEICIMMSIYRIHFVYHAV